LYIGVATKYIQKTSMMQKNKSAIKKVLIIILV
jgi:hypothetical protein